jgi:hypothetical protein
VALRSPAPEDFAVVEIATREPVWIANGEKGKVQAHSVLTAEGTEGAKVS